MPRKYKTPDSGDILKRLEKIYAQHDIDKFMREYEWYKAGLTDVEKKIALDLISPDHLLIELREAYVSRDAWLMEELLKDCGWLLDEETIGKIKMAIKSIDKGELLDYAYKMLNKNNVSKNTTIN